MKTLTNHFRYSRQRLSYLAVIGVCVTALVFGSVTFLRSATPGKKAVWSIGIDLKNQTILSGLRLNTEERAARSRQNRSRDVASIGFPFLDTIDDDHYAVLPAASLSIQKFQNFLHIFISRDITTVISKSASPRSPPFSA